MPSEDQFQVKAVSLHTKLKGPSQGLRCKCQLTVWTAAVSGICGKTHEPGKKKKV